MTNVADQEDMRFFLQHRDRQAHIRNARQAELVIDKQRGAAYVGEMEREFRRLGGHDRNRRRVLLWRIPPDNPFYDPKMPGILKIPFLAFSDETIEDTDAVLLGLVHDIMANAKG